MRHQRQPVGDVTFEAGRTLEKLEMDERKTCGPEQRTEGFRGRERPRIETGSRDAAREELGLQGVDHPRDIARATQFADEAPTALQGPPGAGDDQILSRHPVQCGIRERGIEHGGQIELLGIHHMRIETALAGRRDLLGTAVDCDDGAARCRQLRGETAVAATDVEYALARPRREQVEQRFTEAGDEAGFGLVATGIPVLSHRAIIEGSPARLIPYNAGHIDSSFVAEEKSVSTQIRAIVAEEVDGRIIGSLKTLSVGDLPDNDVLVDVAYSTVNYKDGLAMSGAGRICRQTPMVGGIDLAGVVAESRDPAWKPGDRVLVNGYGLSEDQWGGYAQKQRVKGSFLVRVPEVFGLDEAMAIGTAGYTAMLCVNAIRDHGVTPERGPVLVSGAGGGVGSVAIMLLARLGYPITAITGRASLGDYLKSLGASEILDRADFARETKPLEKERWAAGVDNVGATTLATMLAQTKYEGIIAACGLAGGVPLPTTVMPFILRGVTLRGIDSVQAAMPRRLRAWQDLADLLDRSKLKLATRVEPLARVPELAKDILAGKVQGRIVIDVNA